MTDTSRRCDACGAQAYWETTDAQQRVLCWCNHHFTKFETKLRATTTVEDHTAELESARA